MNSDIFGAPLARDPAVALPEVQVHPRVTPGPVRKQQFVVELVGPRTVPAPSVMALFDETWQGALGTPEIYVMAPSDAEWVRLDAASKSASFDSIALAWDLLSERGALSLQSVRHLWSVAENLANQLQRRAIAMPVPDDIDLTVDALREVRDKLDIGINFTLVPLGSPFVEKDIWRAAAALGLEFGPAGTFQWRVQGCEEPLLELSPAEGEGFSLAQVQTGEAHSALGLGFWLPRSPNPKAALDGCFRVGDYLAQRLGGAFLDESLKNVDQSSKAEFSSWLVQAVDSMTQAGFEPGSTEALKMFR